MKTAIIEKCIALLIVIGEIVCKFLESRTDKEIKSVSTFDVASNLKKMDESCEMPIFPKPEDIA